MTLEWSPSLSFGVSYGVYRNNLLIGISFDTTYVDKSLIFGGLYEYKVNARDSLGNLSNFSDSVDTLIVK